MTSSAGPGALRLDIETAVKGSTTWIHLRGDADIATLGYLQTRLDSVVLDGHPDFRLDLSGVEFIDAASLRCLTSFAVRLRQGGYQVTTLGAPPVLRRMVEVLPENGVLGLA